MDTLELKRFVENLNVIDQSEFYVQLEERKKEEIDFHNKDRERKHKIIKNTKKTVSNNTKYYRYKKRRIEYTNNWIQKNSNGKIFLDYACGEGGYAFLSANEGSALSIGIDISNYAVDFCNQKKKINNIDNVVFYQGDCEDTKLPACSVDTIICSGMLHHLNLSTALEEMNRILKPGGKILAIEALKYNPIFMLYRKFTPNLRTRWESKNILSYKSLELARNYFDVTEIKHWHLFSVLSPYFRFMAGFFDWLDYLLLKLPLVKKMSWMFSFELVKK